MDLEPEGIVPPDTDSGVGADPVVREIEQLLSDGKLEQALTAIDLAIRDGRGITSDLTFLRGDAYLGLGMAREAEQQFREVLAGDPDCPSSRCWLAMSLFLQWRFEEAEREIEVARALPDALADADVIAGCLLERRGALDEAEGLFERAAAAMPDKYVVPTRLERAAFDKEVQRAARGLPRQFRQSLDRVPVIVQDLPDDAFASSEDHDEVSPDMLGLFEGVPLPETDGYDGELRPNKIYLFQRNLERMSATRDELVEQIRITLYHELGHYLGFEEEDMDDLGLA
ncbi:MAG: metallopeptidase family protein [Planctomycetes bacterium]|nr:metallopeptidase family protein [Planctomycetota bacterium]